MKYDIESFLSDLSSILQAQLNAKLDAITAEKGDGIALKHVLPAAYHLQTLDDRPEAHDPYLIYGVVDVQADSVMGATAQRYVVHAMVVVQNARTKNTIVQQSFRYARAMRELMEENFRAFKNASKLSVSTLAPVPITEIGSGLEFMGSGVGINVTLA